MESGKRMYVAELNHLYRRLLLKRGGDAVGGDVPSLCDNISEGRLACAVRTEHNGHTLGYDYSGGYRYLLHPPCKHGAAQSEKFLHNQAGYHPAATDLIYSCISRVWESTLWSSLSWARVRTRLCSGYCIL